MRLIDADALRETIIKGENISPLEYHLTKQYEYIENAPTVEPKTGHWIDEGVYADNYNVHAYRCSECEGHVLEYPNEVNEHNPHCKWCGTKMEEENAIQV